MVAMSGSGPGYMQTIIITPYMHNMIFHIPTMMKKHGSLRKFSGQGTTYLLLFIIAVVYMMMLKHSFRYNHHFIQSSKQKTNSYHFGYGKLLTLKLE